MMLLALFFLASFGLAFVLGASKISLPFRELLAGKLVMDGPDNAPYRERRALIPYLGPFLVALVECPGCLGWWLGATVGWAQPEVLRWSVPGLSYLTDSTFGCGVLLGLATAAVNMLLAKKVGMLD